jgi:STE24 endopeptidase
VSRPDAPSRPPSPWRRTPAVPADLFSADELDRSRRYGRPLARLRVARALLTAGALAALVATQALPRLFDALAVDGWLVQLAVAVVVVQLTVLVVDLPLDAWVDLVHDRRWGLSTQTAPQLLADRAKALVLGTLLTGALAAPVYGLARQVGWWWLAGWGVVTVALVVGAVVVPVVVAPLFNRFTPLADEALAARVRQVADRAGVAIAGVQVADQSRRSRRDNAYVTGLGPTRRVVLHDTILTQPPELLVQVVAHELGHVRRHHVLAQLPALSAAALVVLGVLGLAGSWEGLWSAVGVDGIGDPAGLPLVLLIAEVAAAVVGLGVRWLARVHERAADLDALELLGRPDDAEAMLRRLHVGNLADLDPGPVRRLRGTHPPAAERLAFVAAWRAGGAPAPGAEPALPV